MNFSTWLHQVIPVLSTIPEWALTYVRTLSTISLIAYGLLIFLLVWGYSLFNKYRNMQPGPAHNSYREAEQAAKSHDPFLAGKLYEQAQDYHQAIEAYKSARAFQEVGRVYEKLKQWDDAAQFYSLSGNTEKSALMYQRGGNYLQAAECYLACNKNLLAAEMYEKCREYKKAAGQYENFGKQLKSAHLYKLSEDYERAAEKFEAYFLKQKVVSSSQSPEKLEQVRQAAYESGMLYLKIKRYKNAMEIFSAGEFHEQAAEAAVQAGDIKKAAQCYLSAKCFEKAAQIYTAMGDTKRGHWMMAKQHQKDGDFLRAAKAFEAGESWVEAAEMYEQSGDKGGAGAMYQQAGDYHRSADLFLAVGNLESAAISFEKGGRLTEASDLYVQLKQYARAAKAQELIGDYYEAALLFREGGYVDECISYLQKVDPNSENFYSATLLLGECLIERGMIPAAKDCFKKVVSKEPISPQNIEIHYQLAAVYESEKNFKDAEALYERILRKDYNYKDVKKRSAFLKKA
ncbi:MAG: hypothetical protein ACE5F7_11070, partial [Nitrospiria bacterium]